MGGVWPSQDLARAMQCSMLLAKEHLACAESRGLLCRDEGPAGLLFYRNIFARS